MNHLDILRDDVKREVCNRCDFLGSTMPDQKVCARTGETIVAFIARNFSEDDEVMAASPEEQVAIELGNGVTVESTKAGLIDSLLSTQGRLAEEANACTGARSVSFLSGSIEDFEPTIVYARDELMASLSSDV